MERVLEVLKKLNVLAQMQDVEPFLDRAMIEMGSEGRA
jgi:hypothetical protein